MFRPVAREVRSRKDVLKTSTIRDFSGGWNVIDSDLNLSSKYARTFENSYRKPDGSVALRWGTKRFSVLSSYDFPTAPASAQTWTTIAASDLVTFTYTGLVSPSGASVRPRKGWTATITNLPATIDGIPKAEFEAGPIITAVTSTTFTVQVTTPASAGTTGSPAGVVETMGAYTGSVAIDTGASDHIINHFYYNGLIIVASKAGRIYSVDSNGDVTPLFDEGVASLSPTSFTVKWDATAVFVSFAVFRGDLIICNGVNKPLIVTYNGTDAACDYGYDLGNPYSTLNMPIGKYVKTMNHRLSIAGDPSAPGLIHISNYDTSGTWEGDASSDGTSVQVDTIIETDDSVITGIARFRGRLFAMFDNAMSPGQYNLYDASLNHIPNFEDVIEKNGCISHRSVIALGDDMYSLDNEGVTSAKRAVLTEAFDPVRVSELIDPDIQAAVVNLTVEATLNHVFSIYNPKERQYMLFIPNHSTYATATETTGYVATFIPGQKQASWSKFTGWKWRSGCTSELGRVFFATDDELHVMGAPEDPLYFDADDETPDAETDTPVTFDWEMPWADFKERMNTKTLKYLHLDTKGTEQFTVKVYVDNILIDELGADNPTLTMQFVGGDSGGYGREGQPYGGGRRSADERLWKFPVKFKIIKFRFQGTATEELRFVSITVGYEQGSIRR